MSNILATKIAFKAKAHQNQVYEVRLIPVLKLLYFQEYGAITYIWVSYKRFHQQPKFH